MKTYQLKKVLAATALSGALLFAAGCKDNPTEPGNSMESNSQTASEIMASSLGTDAGGAGVSFADAYSLTQGQGINGTFEGKGPTPSGLDSSYDASSGQHTLTVTRIGEIGAFIFNDTIVYKYTFRDAAGNPQQYFAKGMTDEIDISVTKTKNTSYGERLDVTANANGSWTIIGIISGSPVLTGSYEKDGTVTFHTMDNGDKTFTYSLTFNFDHDIFVKDGDHVYLKGNATSTFDATSSSKGYTIHRETKITFNGDGTAILEVTRPDGTVDTYTIDVKQGLWLFKGRKK